MSESILEIDDAVLEKLLVIVHKLTGITMSVNKKNLIKGRLRPRMRELKLDSYESYLRYLEKTPNEVQAFINLITTNETSFFRTKRVWDFFESEFLPHWHSENPKKTLLFWSAAASSGEESYSAGICCEEFRLKNPNFNYQIYGSDISTEVLAKAEKGEYAGRSIASFKEDKLALFDKYLQLNGDVYRIRDQLRAKIRFFQHNLFKVHPQANHFDIVFIRNVLIYFGQTDQEQVLANIYPALTAKGVLVIGESESLSSLKTEYKYKSPLIYEKS
jgi:chemotaxis protein methyltransferase CheR